MKYRIVFLMIITAISLRASAQPQVTLENLRAPNSPGFILLDVAPSAVDVPATGKAFSTTILSAINNNDGIPRNYAFEFTPYWFFEHKNLTAFKYYGYDKPNNKQEIWSQARYLSLSLAYVNNDSSVNSAKNIAAGLRTTLIRYRKKIDVAELEEVEKKRVAIIKIYSDEKKSLESRIFKLKKKLVSGSEGLNKDSINAEIADLERKKLDVDNERDNDTSLKESGREICAILQRNKLFNLDFAIASNVQFDGNDIDSRRLGRFGAWLTPCLSIGLFREESKNKNNYLNCFGTARYLYDNYYSVTRAAHIKQNILDAGAKVELEFERFKFSYEWIKRLNLDDDDLTTYRSSGMMSYKIMDGVYISSALGKNFGDINNLISHVALDWGIGNGNENVHAK